MSARPAVFASLLVGAFVLPLSHSAPSATKYHFDLQAETVVDLSVFGQPQQVTTIDLKAWVGVTLSDSAGGKVVHAIVDSLKAVTTLPAVTTATADSAKGGMIHGFVDPSGRVKSLASTPAANQLLAMVRGIVNGIFPRIKSGVKAGDKWVDTTDVNNTGEGNNTKARLAIEYTAGAMEAVAGVPALAVTATSTSVVTGTIDNPMTGTMEVEGTGKGGGTFYVGTDGRFLGGSLSSTIDQKFKITGAPSLLPVKVTQKLTVTAIR